MEGELDSYLKLADYTHYLLDRWGSNLTEIEIQARKVLRDLARKERRGKPESEVLTHIEENAMQLTTDTYKIVRHYERGYSRRTIATGLTLAEAQAHCKDLDTSSKTAWSTSALARTKRHGLWFDGYDKE